MEIGSRYEEVEFVFLFFSGLSFVLRSIACLYSDWS
jgi:hypothetical protein